MKEKNQNNFGKVFLIFSKWTKKMSKNASPKILLLTKNFVSIMKNYGVILNQKKFFYDDNFFIKNLKIFSFTNL